MQVYIYIFISIYLFINIAGAVTEKVHKVSSTPKTNIINPGLIEDYIYLYKQSTKDCEGGI